MTLTALLFDNPITRLPSNLYNLFFSSDQSDQLPSKLPNDLDQHIDKYIYRPVYKEYL